MAPKKKAASRTTSKLSIAELKSIRDISTKAHGFAQNTNIKYDQWLREARKWLKELVETEKSPNIPPEVEGFGDGYNWKPGELEDAFNNIPTRASPWILGLFIAYKCFEQKTTVATAWQIHAAFKQVWESMYVESFILLSLSIIDFLCPRGCPTITLPAVAALLLPYHRACYRRRHCPTVTIGCPTVALAAFPVPIAALLYPLLPYHTRRYLTLPDFL